MPLQRRNMSTYSFSAPRHERIYQRLLRLVSPGSAAFFRDACHHAAEPEAFESTSHIVGHLLREVESSIRDAFQPLIQSMRAPRPHEAERRRHRVALAE